MPRLVCRRRGLYQASIHSKIAEASWSCGPALGVEQLALHGRPERLDHRVVHARRRRGPSSRAARLRAAGARTPRRCIASRGRSGRSCPARVAGARWPSAGRRRPARSACGRRSTSPRLTGEHVEDGAAVDLAGRGGVFGDVGAPQPVRRVGERTGAAPGRRAVPAPAGAALAVGVAADPGPAGQPHQPGDPLAADPDAHPEAQLGVHPRRPVGAARGRVDVDDGVGQVGVVDLAWRRRPVDATRSSPTVRLRAPGRPPRRRCRRRRALGPAGTLFWEHVLPGEVGGGPLEDLDLHLLDPELPPQPDQLGPLVSRQTRPCGPRRRRPGPSSSADTTR